MAFFENLGKKVGEAAQTAAKKSSDLVEVTKLNMSISSEEDKIQELYIKMGKKIYENYCSGNEPEDDFQEDCELVKKHQLSIDNIRKRIREIKNIIVCENCNTEIANPVGFCPKCGSELKVEEPSSEQQQETPKEKQCPTCGTVINDGASFCTGCGSKVD